MWVEKGGPKKDHWWGLGQGMGDSQGEQFCLALPPIPVTLST